jgi:hypothetical protein
MPQGPHDRRVAPHVQAAIAVIQPKARGLSPAPAPAPHLRAAVDRSRQPPPPNAPAKASPAAAPPAAQTKAAPWLPRAAAGGVVQRAAVAALTGPYAVVGGKLKRYAGWLYEKWEAQLIEGQKLGRPAPKLGVHAGGAAGGDNTSAQVRIEKADTAMVKWYSSLQESQAARGGGGDGDDGGDGDEYKAGPAPEGFARVDVDREAGKRKKRVARRLEFEKAGKSSSGYIPPWNGGPSAWPK